MFEYICSLNLSFELDMHQVMPSTYYTWPTRGPAASLYFLLQRYYVAALRNTVLLILQEKKSPYKTSCGQTDVFLSQI